MAIFVRSMIEFVARNGIVYYFCGSKTFKKQDFSLLVNRKTQNMTTIEPEKQDRLQTIFKTLLPTVDALADKIRLLLVLGVAVTIWLLVWCINLKHLAWWLTALIATSGLIPTLILARFWWALEELKNLPEIAGNMMGDAKAELQESVQNLKSGNMPKLSILSAGKSLWSVGAMARETRELVGSYLSIATLANPFMIILGVISVFGVFILFLVGVGLAFFAF